MSGRKKKRRYRRSTPLGRLRRNAEKAGEAAELVAARLRSWQVAGDDSPGQARVRKSVEVAEAVKVAGASLVRSVESLEEVGFVPPRRPSDYQPEVGHLARVLPAYREKYEALYAESIARDPGTLDSLEVVRVLPSGEVVVRRGRRVPFVARKTHLARVRRSEP